MNKFVKNNWIGIVLLIAIVVVGYFSVKKGWFKTNKSSSVPTGNAQDGSEVTLSSAEITNRAKSVYDTFTNHWLYWSNSLASEELNALQRLKDADLIAVANEYSEMYVDKDLNTLKSLLQAENLGWSPSNLRNEIVARLNKLNL